MHLAIIGCGFVGSTYKKVLSERHQIHVVDPGINNNKITDHSTYDGIIYVSLLHQMMMDRVITPQLSM